MAWAQRLGYLLEHVGAGGKAAALKDYVRRHAKESTALMPGPARACRDDGWKLYVNTDVESEL